jgi:hypothetical protein
VAVTATVTKAAYTNSFQADSEEEKRKREMDGDR